MYGSVRFGLSRFPPLGVHFSYSVTASRRHVAQIGAAFSVENGVGGLRSWKV